MRSDHLLLQDILEAIDEVLDTTPAARDAYDADKFLRSHMLRHIPSAKRFGDCPPC